MRIVLTLCCLFGLMACQQKSKPELIGRWVGAYYELDREEYQPFPTLLDIRADSTYHTKYFFDEAPEGGKWSTHGNQIWIDSLIYEPGQWQLSEGHLIMTQSITFPFHYFPPILTPLRVDTAAFRQMLGSTIWETTTTVESFGADGLLQVKPKESDFSNTHCWSVAQYEELLFLVKKGNQVNCERFHQFVEQVVDISEDQFITYRWTAQGFQTCTYKRVKDNAPSFEQAPFQLCNKYLYKSYPRHRYYYQGTKYKGGLYRVRKLVDEQFQPIPGNQESGLIRIRFVVNCEGHAGQYEVLELDNDYRESAFDPRLTQQLLTITKGLQDWTPGRDDNTDRAIDTYTFLTFRIQGGQITEIFP
ncbi:MAG: hypothetical protein AAF798_03470 [Bacteroidota bacterium]